MTQQRAHGVHLRVTSRAVAAGSVNFFHDCRRCADRQAAAAELFRDQCGEKAGFREGIDKGRRIGPLAVKRPPVFAGELLAQRADGGADIGEVV